MGKFRVGQIIIISGNRWVSGKSVSYSTLAKVRAASRNEYFGAPGVKAYDTFGKEHSFMPDSPMAKRCRIANAADIFMARKSGLDLDVLR